MVWGRSWVLGAVVAASGIASHLMGQGRLPGPWALGGVFVACVLVVSCFLRVRASSARLVLLVVGGQTFVHAALSGLAGHRGDSAGASVSAGIASGAPAGPAAASSSETPERFFDHYQALSAATPAPAGGEDWLAHQVQHLTDQSPLMVAAHLLGATAVALFLAVGEGALWRILLLTAARARVRTGLWLLCLTAHRTRHGVSRAASLLGLPAITRLRPALLDRRTRHHRGPPYVLAA